MYNQKDSNNKISPHKPIINIKGRHKTEKNKNEQKKAKK